MENANVKTNCKNNNCKDVIISNTDMSKNPDPEELFYMVYSKVQNTDLAVGIDITHVRDVIYEDFSIKTERKDSDSDIQSETLIRDKFAYRIIITDSKYIVSIVKLTLKGDYWHGELYGHKIFTTEKEVADYLTDLVTKHVDPESIVTNMYVNMHV